MIRIELLLILFFGFTSCYTIERDCKDYKTGTFYFTYTIDGVETKGTFTRTENLNIDYFNGKVDSASIRWINDCEFIQRKINPKSMFEQEAIHFKILTTTDSSYTFEYKLAAKKANQKLRVEKGVAYLKK
ncbi:hypothetical protein RM697_02460 [Ichthyenterobacterium sp. W332]|uniref:DNA topoisomerase IV n=1 Tax=Microcosmobacter mediterraneus TaxID=3075607 RepID=A0ABU2YH77_9FLAO|nr:hypothetical protein [Ichthyenterobacterium sp. W332]MDT0557493.1 hypothetical protein [Ichthyenterobacterium sp. W332]